jgi:endonuclease III
MVERKGNRMPPNNPVHKTRLKMKMTIEKLMAVLGGKFSAELGIDLSNGESQEIFKWFLASKLYGARISSKIAARTYAEFQRRDVLTPEKLLETGWEGLVRILDDGGYARYDFSTATKLLEIMKKLKRDYDGDLNELHRKARDPRDLEVRLKALGKGIGAVTVNIFLRELRTAWPKARPDPSELVKLAAKNLGLLKGNENVLVALEQIWTDHPILAKDFCDFEAALIRLGKDYCRPSRYEACPLKAACPCRRRLR